MGSKRNKSAREKIKELFSTPLSELGSGAKGYIVRTPSDSEKAGALQEKIFIGGKKDSVTVIDVRIGIESKEIHSGKVRTVDPDTARREQERMRKRITQG